MNDIRSQCEQGNSAARVCHYCELSIAADEKAIEAKTKNAWAHVTCWYDKGPFEREMREKGYRTR